MFSRWIFLSLFFNNLSVVVCQGVKTSLYIIRNAEASPNSNGLSNAGIVRASQCLPKLFGPTSLYNIGLVMACTPDPNSSTCQASFSTAQPIAASLGLTVDTSCAVGESSPEHCIKTTISNFAATSDSAILLIWDANHLSDLQAEFGLRRFTQDQVDVIYTLRNYIYVSETPQNCGAVDGANGGPVPAVNTALPAPPTATIPVPGPTSQVQSRLDLYYTTTFTIPDSTSTPVVSIIPRNAFTGPKQKRRLHSKDFWLTRVFNIAVVH